MSSYLIYYNFFEKATVKVFNVKRILKPSLKAVYKVLLMRKIYLNSRSGRESNSGPLEW
jgi:hypothetical protein